MFSRIQFVLALVLCTGKLIGVLRACNWAIARHFNIRDFRGGLISGSTLRLVRE